MKSKIGSPSVVEVRDVPAIEKDLLTPVEFVKHWVAVFGNFQDGKIEKSRLMQSEELTIKDAKYLLDVGVGVAQIAKQYNMDESTLTIKLIENRLLPSLDHESAAEDDDVVWFSESGNKANSPLGEPAVRFLKNNITINSAFAEKLESEYVHIGVMPNNQIKIKPSNYGLKIQGNNNRSKTKRISCASARNLLMKQGIEIPATFKMTKDVSGCWVGVLIRDDTQ